MTPRKSSAPENNIRGFARGYLTTDQYLAPMLCVGAGYQPLRGPLGWQDVTPIADRGYPAARQVRKPALHFPVFVDGFHLGGAYRYP